MKTGTHTAPKADLALKSFEILVRQHHRGLLAYALTLVPDAAAGEDIVQEAFLVAYRRLADFDASRDFGAWMRGIIRHSALAWRRAHRQPPIKETVLRDLEQLHMRWSEQAREEGQDPLDALRECLSRLAEQEGRLRVALMSRPCRPALRTGNRTDPQTA